MWKVIGLIVGIFFGTLIIGFIGGAWNIFVTQPSRIVQQTFDANNVLYNYEWFRNQYNDVLAIDRRINNTSASIAVVSDAKEKIRLNQVLLGLQNQREGMVAAYNANAMKTNRNIFINPPLGGERLPDFLQ